MAIQYCLLVGHQCARSLWRTAVSLADQGHPPRNNDSRPLMSFAVGREPHCNRVIVGRLDDQSKLAVGGFGGLGMERLLRPCSPSGLNCRRAARNSKARLVATAGWSSPATVTFQDPSAFWFARTTAAPSFHQAYSPTK